MTQYEGKVKFSEKFIRELPVKDKPYNLMEDNLRIRIYPTGTKSWSFYKTDLTGKRVPETLGAYPQVSFKQVKQMATDTDQLKVIHFLSESVI